jgi:hypothetical protein
MRFSGDDSLSAMDRKLWSLCYSTLQRFGCLTMFKTYGPDARVKLNHMIKFYVPGHHPRALEVRAYLEDELRHEARAPTMIGDDWCFGCQVGVELFSGIDGYATHDEMAPLIDDMIENLYAKLSARQLKSN